MHEKSSEFAVLILQVLSRNASQNYTLEELTEILIPLAVDCFDSIPNFENNRIQQAKVLETLILLDDQRLIFLNPVTDQSCITASGLQKIKQYTS